MNKAAWFLTLVFLSMFQPGDFERKAEHARRLDGKARPNTWFYRQRAFPFAELNYEAFDRALASARSMAGDKKAKRITRWELVAPRSVAGRVTDVEITSDETIYAGAASGGVFQSNDLGLSWAPIFDDVPTLSIGDIAIAPSKQTTVYVGTGEANGGGGSLTYGGSGVYKSTDGGETWLPTGLKETRYIGRVAVHPRDPDTLFVAAMGVLFGTNQERGLFRSRDGGLSWEKVLYVSDLTGCIDVTIHPENPDIVFAAMWERSRVAWDLRYGGSGSGLYRSIDGGSTWTLLENGLPQNRGDIGRIGIALAPSSPETGYAVYADADGFFAGIFKTVDNGESWARVQDSGLADMYASFGWWFGNIRVHPLDPDYVITLGLLPYISRDGGNSWTEYHETLTPEEMERGAFQIHVDQHGLCFSPRDPNRILLANDGGVYLSEGERLRWIQRSNMPTSQFYTCEIDSSNPDRLYGGLQDNGVRATNAGGDAPWEFLLGGDGMHVLVDPGDGDSIYLEYQYGFLFHLLNGEYQAGYLALDPNDRFNWNTPIAFDPSDSRVLYLGTQRVYRTENGLENWEPISGDLTDGPVAGNRVYGTLTAIAPAPSNGKVVYAGSDDGNLWVTRNGGDEWTSISNGLPKRWVTRVAVDPANDLIAYVTLSGYRDMEYIPHILRTADGGNTWQDIGGNLPEAPVNDVIVDPDRENTLFAATDVGVFFTRDTGVTWQILGDGLPLVPVNDLDYHPGSGLLVAATFGRSMHRIDIADALAETEPKGTTLAHVYLVPELLGNAEIHILNPGEETMTLDIFGFDDLGQPAGKRDLILEPLQKAALATGTLFAQPEQSPTWLQIGADREAVVMVWLNEPGVSSAYWASQPGSGARVPHVARNTASFQTMISTVNAAQAGIRHQIRSGPEQITATLHQHQRGFARVNRDVRTFFGANLDSVLFAELEADRPVTGTMEYFVTLPEKSQMAALGLDDRSGTTIRFLHLAENNALFWTGVVTLNVGDSATAVTQSFYDKEGNLIQTRGIELQPGEKDIMLRDHLGSLDVPEGAAWAEAIADQPLIGYELFGATELTENDFFAGLQGSLDQGAVLDYPFFKADGQTWTGLVAVNSGGLSADLTFTVYDAAGNDLETKTVKGVAPRAKITLLANTFFENAGTLENGAWVRAVADGSSWSGFQLWGDHQTEPRLEMAGVNARVR